MKVVGKELLTDFSQHHADVRSQITSWLCEVEEAQWQTPSEIKERYPRASFLANSRIIFDLKGNKYRLDTKVNYRHQTVLIKRIGTHAEYSKWEF